MHEEEDVVSVPVPLYRQQENIISMHIPKYN